MSVWGITELSSIPEALDAAEPIEEFRTQIVWGSQPIAGTENDMVTSETGTPAIESSIQESQPTTETSDAIEASIQESQPAPRQPLR